MLFNFINCKKKKKKKKKKNIEKKNSHNGNRYC